MRSALLKAALAGALAVPAAVAAAAQDGAATLTVQTSEEHGPYVADGDGRALYMFEADTRGEGETEAVSNCEDACAEAWPPLIAESPKAGEQMQAELIGTIERRDGQRQVTYNGWPLYYFVRDENPGDTNGHDIEGFGAEWYLLTPAGEKVGEH